MSSLRAAIAFLTRVPMGESETPDDLAAGVPWFPVVGALLGVTVGAVYLAFLEVVPAFVAAALAIAASATLTGAFHEDGLADTVDAFGGGSNPADAVRILKDPRLGTFGVLALVLSSVAKIALIGTFRGWGAVTVLGAAHALSRALAIGLLGVVRPSHAEGLGASYARSLSRARIVTTVSLGALIAGLLIGWWVLPALLAALIPVSVIGRLATNKVGGVTGDVLGAAQQVAELAVLIVGCAVVVNGWGDLVWWR